MASQLSVQENPSKKVIMDVAGVLAPEHFRVDSFGPCEVPNDRSRFGFVSESERVLLQPTATKKEDLNPQLAFEVAGQREKFFFKPEETTIGIVTCGGLCPGLNNVIRSLTFAATSYHVKKIIGFKYGYSGLSKDNLSCITLDTNVVNSIHLLGGSFLGSSRGPIPAEEMLNTLVAQHVDILFTLGGDGTQRGAELLAEAVKRRGLKIAIVGIPKTIDNDILYVSRTFGFDTAVEEARTAIACANAEASSAQHGIGLVKLMGRDSGFVAAKAALASGDVNICLIPEEPFELDALMDTIRLRLLKRNHCVIVVAEGAGLDILRKHNTQKTDKSGNVSFGDIGIFLKESISAYFKSIHMDITIKYIDPSYIIRSVPPNATDAAFCAELSNKAMDSAMSGKTGCIVGYWNEVYTLVPFGLIKRGRKKVDLHGSLWNTVKQMTCPVVKQAPPAPEAPLAVVPALDKPVKEEEKKEKDAH